MTRSLVHKILLIIALVGCCQAIIYSVHYGRLQDEHRRLQERIGLMPLSDVSKPHFKALPSSDPLDFIWRVYLPDQYPARWRMEHPGGGSSTSSSFGGDARSSIVRVRFRKHPEGHWQVWTKRFNGSSLGGVGPAWAEWLENPQRLSIEQLGREEVAVIDDDQVATLLKIAPPMEPMADPGSKVQPQVTFQFGSMDAWDKWNGSGQRPNPQQSEAQSP